MSDDITPDGPEEEQVDAGAQEATDDTESSDDDNDFDADKAREKIRKINSENRNLRKRATDAEAKAEDAKGSTERLSALEAENMRLRVGVKHGLPESLVKRLTGTTEEEILQDAEELMELFGGKKPPTQQPKEKLRGGGDPTQQQSEDIDDVDRFAERIFRN
jgi:predicted nuclease with TOPRIM domain